MAEVIEDQGRKYRHKPGKADRAWPEMPHVCVERFTASDRQHDGTEDHQTDLPVTRQEGQAMEGIEGFQDLRLHQDAPDPKHGDGHEPDQRDRAKDPSDLRRTKPLGCEQDENDDHRDRKDESI